MSTEEGEQTNHSENTPLLDATNDCIYYYSDSSPEETIRGDEEGTINDSGFNIAKSKLKGYGTGLGIEPETQNSALQSGAQKQSIASSQRSARDEESTPVEDPLVTTIKSPFLGGVSARQFWLIYAGVLAACFVATFDSTLMASSHPVITSYFHASNSASWLSVAFLLTSTSFQPLFGRLSDTIGRKSPYVFTLGVFLLATIWCMQAQSMTSFVLARAACGLGAGGMMTMSSIITSDLVPIEIRGAYQSYVHIVFGAGSAFGAATGGAIADHLGWRWEFGIQIPLLVILFTGACFTTPRDLGLGAGVTRIGLWEALKLFDYRGSFLLTTSTTFLILGLVRLLLFLFSRIVSSGCVTDKATIESRRECLPVVSPTRSHISRHIYYLLSTLCIHRILCLPSRHASPSHHPQSSRWSYPGQLHRFGDHESDPL